MQLLIDTDSRELRIIDENSSRTLPLYSPEAFEEISRQWLRVGWDQKYPYTFSWLGRPIIQLPEDLIRIQEVIHRVRPDVIIETGVAHGGSLVFYASLMVAMGRGRVVGIDIDIRPHNRQAISEHRLASMITLIEGSSTAEDTFSRVREQLHPLETVMAILDSNHTHAHVAKELELYSQLVTAGSYIVATDGIMEDVADVPRGQSAWREDNPAAAAREFAAAHPEYVLEEPRWPFNESPLSRSVTHWPAAWLRRLR